MTKGNITNTLTTTGDLIKRLRGLADPSAEALSDGLRLTYFCIAAREAADALEAAERVMREIAGARYKDRETVTASNAFDAYGRLNRDYIRLCDMPMDWLARHATGQRKGGDE